MTRTTLIARIAACAAVASVLAVSAIPASAAIDPADGLPSLRAPAETTQLHAAGSHIPGLLPQSKAPEPVLIDFIYSKPYCAQRKIRLLDQDDHERIDTCSIGLLSFE